MNDLVEKYGGPVVRATHLFRCFDNWRATEICCAEGISQADTEAGALEAAIVKETNRIIDARYGSPEYGIRDVPDEARLEARERA